MAFTSRDFLKSFRRLGILSFFNLLPIEALRILKPPNLLCSPSLDLANADSNSSLCRSLRYRNLAADAISWSAMKDLEENRIGPLRSSERALKGRDRERLLRALNGLATGGWDLHFLI